MIRSLRTGISGLKSNQIRMDVVGNNIANVNTVAFKRSRAAFDAALENWEGKDQGMWEVRGEPQHFVFSKLMCWVALDRALRLARKRSMPADVDRWRKNRDMIYSEIMTRGWSDDRQAFVQRYGDDALDAANLVMPLVRFISPNDPRMRKTISAINQPLWKGGLVSDSVVHRYDPSAVDDGVNGPEGGFTLCTFWMVQALSLAGHFNRDCLEQARRLFDGAIRHGGDLGLFAEQIGPDGEAAADDRLQRFLVASTDRLDRYLPR